jgi:hypothetical protein
MRRDGAGASTMWSQPMQENFGRTWRMTLKLSAGMYSSCSETSSPNFRNWPPQSISRVRCSGNGLRSDLVFSQHIPERDCCPDVIVSKFSAHLPLHRQPEIYARQGVDISRSTLDGWVGISSDLPSPSRRSPVNTIVILPAQRCHLSPLCRTDLGENVFTDGTKPQFVE